MNWKRGFYNNAIGDKVSTYSIFSVTLLLAFFEYLDINNYMVSTFVFCGNAFQLLFPLVVSLFGRVVSAPNFFTGILELLIVFALGILSFTFGDTVECE